MKELMNISFDTWGWYWRRTLMKMGYDGLTQASAVSQYTLLVARDKNTVPIDLIFYPLVARNRKYSILWYDYLINTNINFRVKSYMCTMRVINCYFNILHRWTTMCRLVNGEYCKLFNIKIFPSFIVFVKRTCKTVWEPQIILYETIMQVPTWN